MQGSFSIKNILPFITPDFEYTELDEVQEGTAAQVAYLFAALDPHTTPAQKAQPRREAAEVLSPGHMGDGGGLMKCRISN
jgi:hypothetical protein